MPALHVLLHMLFFSVTFFPVTFLPLLFFLLLFIRYFFSCYFLSYNRNKTRTMIYAGETPITIMNSSSWFQIPIHIVLALQLPSHYHMHIA